MDDPDAKEVKIGLFALPSPPNEMQGSEQPTIRIKILNVLGRWKAEREFFKIILCDTIVAIIMDPATNFSCYNSDRSDENWPAGKGRHLELQQC